MLSIPHLIIIFVVVLVVFGPEKLPDLARNLGKVMAEFRKATGDLRMNFEDHLRDLERETQQRRIGGAAPTAAAAPGTVATEAPNTAAAEASLPSMEAQAAASASAKSTASAQAENTQPEPSEPRSETVSDGRTRPA